MDGRDGRGGQGAGTTGGLRVDTVELEEGSGRLARAADDLDAAGDGLERLPVAAVATGADAVLDALADLGRQWQRHLEEGAGQARVLQQELALAAARYAAAEQEAARALEPGPGLQLLFPLPGPSPEHPSQDRVPGPGPVLGPPAGPGDVHVLGGPVVLGGPGALGGPDAPAGAP